MPWQRLPLAECAERFSLAKHALTTVTDDGNRNSKRMIAWGVDEVLAVVERCTRFRVVRR